MNRPFLKWAGGKTRVIPELKKYFDTDIDLFVEPFCGSGSVWINTDYKKYIICDINNDLINLFNTLKNEGPEFIKYCNKLFNKFGLDDYNTLRDKFNKITDIRKKSALFVYLNRHCFNGLCRYNSSGKFNVPVGKYKTIYFPQKEMEFFAEKSENAMFYCMDFRDIFDKIKDEKCMIYCDPPYVPISKTSDFTAYAKTGFNYEDQKDLYKCALETNGKVVISNSYMAKDLYRDMKIMEIDVSRNISANKNNRKSVKEIIAVKEKAR